MKNRIFRLLRIIAVFLVVSMGVLLSLPSLFALTIHQEQTATVTATPELFPVTVDSKNKIIVENAQVNAFLSSANSPLQAAAGNTGNIFFKIIAWIALSVARVPWYQNIAAVGGRFVTITPGMRKEQAATAFADALAWNTVQKKEFMTAAASSTLPLSEGSFSPGIYIVDTNATPEEAQSLVNNRFTEDVLSHYGTTTAQMVPLTEAITIASLIQRETIGTTDMRLVSGIIWNRLFAGMKLQIDSTVQYAKANDHTVSSWWPKVLPGDIYRRSPYNTYQHAGLPPTAIANPSVAAIVAALNPLQTPCFYYFNDQEGTIHCSNTYAEHVTLLKKYYGQGK